MFCYLSAYYHWTQRRIVNRHQRVFTLSATVVSTLSHSTHFPSFFAAAVVANERTTFGSFFIGLVVGLLSSFTSPLHCGTIKVLDLYNMWSKFHLFFPKKFLLKFFCFLFFLLSLSTRWGPIVFPSLRPPIRKYNKQRCELQWFGCIMRCGWRRWLHCRWIKRW